MKKNWIIINFIINAILFEIRTSNFGWALVFLGPLLYFPLFILHLITTTLGFGKHYQKLDKTHKAILFINIFLPIIFVLFQYDGGDDGGKYTYDIFNKHYSKEPNIFLDYLSFFSGIMILFFNIKLLKFYKSVSANQKDTFNNNEELNKASFEKKILYNTNDDSKTNISKNYFFVVIYYLIFIVLSFFFLIPFLSIPLIPIEMLLLFFLWLRSKDDNYAKYHIKYQLKFLTLAFLSNLLPYFILSITGIGIILIFTQIGVITSILFLIIGLVEAIKTKTSPSPTSNSL